MLGPRQPPFLGRAMQNMQFIESVAVSCIVLASAMPT